MRNFPRLAVGIDEAKSFIFLLKIILLSWKIWWYIAYSADRGYGISGQQASV
jgi:hypothetical protein